MSQLHVELVAADRKVWEGEARQVNARTVEGELGILPGHTPLLGILVEGADKTEIGKVGHAAAAAQTHGILEKQQLAAMIAMEDFHRLVA